RVLIYAPDDDLARGIGDALSTFAFASISFAHSAAPGALARDTPLVIARDADAAIHDQVLLNLHDAAPQFFSRFQRLVEVVSCGDDDRAAARQRFRFYRDRGYEIHHHDIAGGGA